MRMAARLLASGLLAAGLLAGCRAAPRRPANLLLITVDTLRADRLGAYGYDRPTSPEIDAFAETALVFERAQSTSSWTLPSLASLMTSLYPPAHGCTGRKTSLGEGYETLAEVLTSAGYRTGAVASHVFLGHRFGLQQGFADYDEELVQENKLSHKAITSEQVTDKTIRWLRDSTTNEAPFFFWAHYFDPHRFYQAHEGIAETFGTRRSSDLYDGEIAFTSGHIGRLLAALDELDLTGRTVVVLTADHGEEFKDHGEFGHKRSLYREVLQVPLMIRAPALAAGRSDEVVSLVDVRPTVLDLLGLEPEERTAGRSLVAARSRPRPVIAQLAIRQGRLDGVVDGPWKMVRNTRDGGVELFETGRDPWEENDVASERPEIVKRLGEALDQALAESAERGASLERGATVDLSSKDLEKLEALGYVD